MPDEPAADHARRGASRRSRSSSERDRGRGGGRRAAARWRAQLEGLTRNVGMHAGGVLIAPGKLTDFCPLYQQPTAATSAVSQFDKDDVEAIGLVKFDFLGLATLTILDWTRSVIVRAIEGREDFDSRPAAGRPRGLQAVRRRQRPTAVFQFESRGMQRAC
ncbi:MAG: hypothetical protein MZW92_35695 [Comamonadaceae bacterium]|nr:hypothetical protein [Comamonadaceae bacterium]